MTDSIVPMKCDGSEHTAPVSKRSWVQIPYGP